MKTYLYSLEFPTGKLFDIGYVEKHAATLKEDGFVDTPSKLDLPEPEPEVLTEAQADALDPADIVAKVKAMGFHVFTDIELQSHTNKAIDAAFIAEANESDTVQAKGLEDFNRNPTDLTKEELVVLGSEHGLKLKMTMKEQTMINLITAHFSDETE